MEFKDYYKTLGVKREATPDEIKRSFRRLARKFHPDVSEEADAEERFKEVQEAYEVLKDPDKRAAYDQFGADWKAGQDFRPPPGWHSDVHFSPDDFSGAGDFSEFFETLFGGPRRRGSRRGFRTRMKGEDLSARVALSIEDAYRGTPRSVMLQVPEVDGEGYAVTRAKTLKVNVPKGVTDGQRIRLAGQGAPGPNGGPPGDLYLQVVFEPHATYRVVGRDVHMVLPVAPWEAALGRTVTVPTLGGRVELKIPPNSQGGNRLRLKGRGFPGKPPGDQLVELEVVTPSADTAGARALYEQMERELEFDPRADMGV